MSITSLLPVSTATGINRRTWRVQIETPKGQDPIVEIFRESVKIDAQGNAVEDPIKEFTSLRFIASATNIAVLPPQFQPVPGLISQFGDYLDQLPKSSQE